MLGYSSKSIIGINFFWPNSSVLNGGVKLYLLLGMFVSPDERTLCLNFKLSSLFCFSSSIRCWWWKWKFVSDCWKFDTTATVLIKDTQLERLLCTSALKQIGFKNQTEISQQLALVTSSIVLFTFFIKIFQIKLLLIS